MHLETYYNETIHIQDIIPQLTLLNTTGIDPSDDFFNITIRVINSHNQSDYAVNITINITDSTGTVLNTTKQETTLLANTTTTDQIINIDTTTWTADDYIITTSLTGNFTGEPPVRSEPFTFKAINITSSSVTYICNSTTENYDVTIKHPYTGQIEYNVSLRLPSDWSYSGYQLLNASEPGNYTANFTIISDNTNPIRNTSVNASINYTYNNLTRDIQNNLTIQQHNARPILETIRETAQVINSDSVFESALTVHNRGCGTTNVNTIVKEQLSTGWTPANPSIKTNANGTDITLVSSATDLEKNTVTWTLGSIPQDRYAVLTYQIKTPTTISTTGELLYNTTWDDDRLEKEKQTFIIQTQNFTTESHMVL